jgi:hypothetical protein
MSRGNPARDGEPEAEAVARFLRALAARAETDTAFAAHLSMALQESGLLPGKTPSARRHGGVAGKERLAVEQALPDPFALLRAGGPEGLGAALQSLALGQLRQIVRTHRLDPARISSRWTARERVIALIVEQVQARANHGKAFSRV